MSGSRKPPPTALVRRSGPELSDADIAALLHQRRHLFGRKKLHATFDPEDGEARMRIHDEEDADPEGSYVIYDETRQRFVGMMRRGTFALESAGPGRARLVFFPADQA